MDTKYTASSPWFTLALLAITVGAGFAFILGISRTPFGHMIFAPEFFHRALVGHVMMVIVVWLLSFTVVVWTRYLPGAPGVDSKSASVIAGAGAALIVIAVLSGDGVPMINNYMPALTNAYYFAGLLLFLLGFSAGVFAFLDAALRPPSNRDALQDILRVSVLVGALFVLAAALSLAKHGAHGDLSVEFFERLFWAPGHIQQILNGTLFIAVWYALRDAAGLPNPDRAFLRNVNWIFIAAAAAFLVLPFFIDPVTPAARIGAATVYGIALGVPVLLHALHALRGLRAIRGTVAHTAIVLSMTIYFLGITIAYSGVGNDLRLPAHYHGTVISLTLALMGLSYYILGRSNAYTPSARWARGQLKLFGAGATLVIAGLYVPGLFGAPRKTAGVAFTDEPLVMGFLVLLGIGTLLAVAGVLLFMLSAAWSYLRTRRPRLALSP